MFRMEHGVEDLRRLGLQGSALQQVQDYLS